ncbi:hypothetical protein BH10BDE1_BH10BDE1_11110 [soil metagenome]
MKAKKIAKMATVLGLGGLLAVALAEAGLRIAKASRESASQSALPTNDPNLIRIVTLGESTTAPSKIRFRQFDWPYQLEGLLNRWLEDDKSLFRVKVFNLAQAAASSPFMVSMLLERERELRPDVLITMLGVNDSNVVQVERGFFYQNLLSVRLLYWARVAWQCPSCYDVRLSAEAIPEPAGLTDLDREAQRMANAELSKGSLRTEADVDAFAKQIDLWQIRYGIHQHWMNAYLVTNLFRRSLSEEIKVQFPEVRQKILALAEALLRKSYREMVLKHAWTLELYCQVLSALNKKGCVGGIKDAFADGLTPTSPVLTLAAQSGGSDDPEMRAIFRSAGYEFGETTFGPQSLNRSFVRLQNFVNATGTIWFAMQYPTGSIESLKFYMSEESRRTKENFGQNFYMEKSPFEPKFKDVIYVSNANFLNLVQSGKASDYFADMFGRNGGMEFGHTNEKGHAVISENVFASLKENWSSIVERVRARNQRGTK